jgi:hypothetical protein
MQHLPPSPTPRSDATAASNTKHLNQEQLARRWSLSSRTLERWRWLRQGPDYLKIGGRIVYRLEDVEAYEAAHRRHLAKRSETPRSGETA